MEKTAQQADAEFRLTVNVELLTTVFEEHSPASNVDKSLKELLDKYTTSLSGRYDRLVIYHTFARAIRAVLSAWRLLPNVGEELEPGYLIDKMDYGYNANNAIRPKNSEPESIEWQVVHCFTKEWKNHDELTNENLQGIIDGASKQYLVLTPVIDTLESGETPLKIGPEPKCDTITYEAVLNFLPDLPGKHGTKRKVQIGIDEDEDAEPTEEITKTLKKAKRSKKSTEQNQTATFTNPHASATSSPEKKSKRGNFGHGRAIRWNNEEDYWVQQRLREDPSIIWSVLAKQHNDRFEGTMFYDGKNGNIQRGRRSMQAVQKRFVTFRQKMQARKMKGEPIQDTESDVEPEEDSNLSYDYGSVQGDDDQEDVGQDGSSEAPVPDPFDDAEVVEESEVGSPILIFRLSNNR